MQLYFQELYDFELAFIKWRLTRLHSSAALQKRVFNRFASRVLRQECKSGFLHSCLLGFLHLPPAKLSSSWFLYLFLPACPTLSFSPSCLLSFSVFAFSPFLFLRGCGSGPLPAQAFVRLLFVFSVSVCLHALVSHFIFSGDFLTMTFRLRFRTCSFLIGSTIAILAACLFLLFVSPCRTLSIIPVAAFLSFSLL